MKNLALLICFCFGLTACSGENEISSSKASSTSSEATSSINWFNGSVDAAFALAKTDNKPVFLYWGAVWCPPCQEIKNTVFKTRRFIAQSESFVPVYVDGDTPEAQILGERFGVKGYPTMILFSPQGDEITRIPGGIDISQYNDILELSLNSISPTADLVQQVLNKPETVSEDNLKQLAFYSWGQDHQALPEDYDPQLFLTMSNLARDEITRARLYMQYLIAVMQAAEEDDAESVSTAKILPVAGALTRMESILNSDSLVLACWDSLAYYATELLPLVAAGTQAETIKTLWQDRLQALSSQSSLSVAEQLAGILPRLEFYFEGDEDRLLDETTRDYVLKVTASADAATKNSFARQSVINQINHILQSAKLRDEAKALLLRELTRSQSPYYFMSSLASLAEKDGKISESLAWHKKAYESSVGSATRFQWGAIYVRAIIRLEPENKSLITNTSIALLNELQSKADVFAGRNFRVLRSLNKQLVEWQTSTEEDLLQEFTLTINQRCDEQLEGSLEANNCASLTKPG